MASVTRRAQMQVSIIIATHNRHPKLARLLHDIGRQVIPHGCYEVIVVDDGSTDGTEEMVKRLSLHYSLRYHRQECRGPAAARSAGIQQATGELVVLLDDDMRVPPDFISEHLGAHAATGDAIVLGRADLPTDLPNTPFLRYRRALDRTFVPLEGTSGTVFVKAVSSQNLSARRSLFERIGRYREDLLLPGAEEAELSWRLGRTGVQIIYNSAICAYQDDSPVTLRAYCSKNERYAMAGAEVLTKCPEVARDLRSIRALVRTNGPITWGEDPPSVMARKVVKWFLALPPSFAVLKFITTGLERYLPVPRLLVPLYRLMIGLHIFRGFRVGLTRFQVPGSRLAAAGETSTRAL